MNNDVLDRLLEGNHRFTNGLISVDSMMSVRKIHDLAENGQKPSAIILTCSDSRAPAEIVFDQGVGELFVVRVAGNVVAPSLIASMEFAVSNFGSPLIMVLGHTLCSAIRMTMHFENNPTEIPASKNLSDLVDRVRPSIKKIKDITAADAVLRATENNIQISIDTILQESSIIKNLVIAEKLQIVGAILDIHTGRVTVLNSTYTFTEL